MQLLKKYMHINLHHHHHHHHVDNNNNNNNNNINNDNTIAGVQQLLPTKVYYNRARFLERWFSQTQD